MNLLAQTDREALYVAAEGILLDLPHGWLPSGRKDIARLRERDDHGRPSEAASAWLGATASAILRDLKVSTLTAFPTDPVDHACFVAASIYLALQGGLPGDHMAARALASQLRELEAIARRHRHKSKAASGGRSRASSIPKPATGTRAKPAAAADGKGDKTDNEKPNAAVRAAIDDAIRSKPGSSTAKLLRVLRTQLKAMGVELGDEALRKRIERRRQ